MLGKEKDIKSFDDLELDNKPMPMAAEDEAEFLGRGR